jgi:hypothetical protein
MLPPSLRRRPAPATVIALIAVLLACAGSATAGTLIGGAQVRNESLTGRDIKDGSIILRELSDGVRRRIAARRQLQASSQPGPAGPRGATGARGPQGVQGEKGEKGDSVPQTITSAPGRIAVYGDDDITPIDGTADDPSSVADILLPAGFYDATAEITVASVQDDDLILCEMATDGNALTDNKEQQTGFSPGLFYDNAPAGQADTIRAFKPRTIFLLEQDQIVNFDCYDAIPGDAPAQAAGSALFATKLGRDGIQGLVEGR